MYLNKILIQNIWKLGLLSWHVVNNFLRVERIKTELTVLPSEPRESSNKEDGSLALGEVRDFGDDELNARDILAMATNSSPAVQQGATQGPAFQGHTNQTVATTSSAGNGAGNLPSLKALKHDPGLAAEWSVEEQSTLEDGLSKYVKELNILRYIKIAALLPEKTVRDVALRCKWMSKKENSKRRKAEEQNGAKKIKDKKEKFVDPSMKSAHSMPQSTVSIYASLAIPTENDKGISYEAIGGTTGHLLEQNAQVFRQITENLAAYKIQENVDLFCRTRDNIAAILNDLKDMPEVMRQMPPLPVRVNTDLAKTILPTPQNIVLDGTTMHLKQELR